VQWYTKWIFATELQLLFFHVLHLCSLSVCLSLKFRRYLTVSSPSKKSCLITIKKIVREPGERAKVAVESYDDRIDPVGACVGMKGSRIHGIVRELRNENIDVINYTNNNQLLITRALSPAKITSVSLDEETKRAEVYLKPDQVSLAIGKGGHNIKLASKLTGYEIDVYREGAEDIDDVDLDEFTDEIDAWILDELKSIGCDTARSVSKCRRSGKTYRSRRRNHQRSCSHSEIRIRMNPLNNRISNTIITEYRIQ